MKKSWYLFILFTLLTIAGCALFEPKVNESGQTYTDIENYMKTAGGLLQQFGIFIPGWGALVSGFGGLLAIIGGSLTSISMTRKRGKTLDTVIKGVNEASIIYDEAVKILLAELKSKLEPARYLEFETKIAKMTSIKEIIKTVADHMGTESFLHKRVKRIG